MKVREGVFGFSGGGFKLGANSHRGQTGLLDGILDGADERKGGLGQIVVLALEDLFEAAVTVGADEFTLGTFRSMSPTEQLEMWRMNRHRLSEAAALLNEETRVPWYGPSMGAKSFLTARLMEVWAHGTDITDALAVAHPPSSRLRHIAQLGFITRKWSYTVRGLEVPSEEISVSLTGPSGDLWQFGPPNALEHVRGPAEDFCLVVTQRRHVDDTTLSTSPRGREWMLLAQAFAGGPTSGPAAGVR